VWRLRWRGESEHWFYLYLLLEFQSAPEPFMAVRMLVYVGLLLQELIRTQRLKASDRLPPILPIVLYNGKRTWRAPVDLLSLFAAVPEGLRRRLPRLEYVLVDEGCLTREEREQTGNLVSALARLETSRDAEELARSTRELAVLLPRGEQNELRRIFTAWALQVLRRTHRGATIPEVEDLEEVPMLEERIRDWERKARREGRKEGREEGLVEEARRMVLRQMERRFGAVPRRIRERVNAISSLQELDDVADKVLMAGSLQDLGIV
ncbi:MAG TPA: Rpn family recombination-promoting nuclease/putative transposase, partial [Thermoanaerobaculia bacterium]